MVLIDLSLPNKINQQKIQQEPAINMKEKDFHELRGGKCQCIFYMLFHFFSFYSFNFFLVKGFNVTVIYICLL